MKYFFNCFLYSNQLGAYQLRYKLVQLTYYITALAITLVLQGKSITSLSLIFKEKKTYKKPAQKKNVGFFFCLKKRSPHDKEKKVGFFLFKKSLIFKQKKTYFFFFVINSLFLFKKYGFCFWFFS